ncbi:secreted protein, partial [gut metagenome]
MKKKWIYLGSMAFVGLLLYGSTRSYAMDYGGFDIEIGTEEAPFFPENWNQLPESPPAPVEEPPKIEEVPFDWQGESERVVQPENE